MDVRESFRETEEYELLEPYADDEGLIAGYRVEGLLSREPRRYVTYEARAPDGGPVVLKLVRLNPHDSRREARRFGGRLRARAAIHHPNLLPIFDWGRLEDRYYVAMGLCRAPTLAELLKSGPLKTEGCMRLLGQLADALETAHERGLVHRELAPENVLVTARGESHVLLGDFGATSSEWWSGLLHLDQGTYYPSPEYAPPETLWGDRLTAASNVYTLACMLVECLTGSPPYTPEVPGDVAYMHAVGPPPRPSERRSELPVAIDELVAAAMAKDPAERPESSRGLVVAAAQALGLDISPPATHRAPGPRRPDGASAEGAPLNGALGRGLPSPIGTTARVLRPKIPLVGPAWLAGVRRRATAGGAALRRKALPLALALAVVVAASGALGLSLGRSEDEGRSTGRTAVDAAAVQAAQERNAALRIDSALDHLDARRVSERERLATSPTRRAQAAAAARLVSAYRATAQAVPITSDGTARVVSALNEAGGAYRRLAAAARRGHRPGYTIARHAVRRSERDVQRAIVRLNRDGR